MTGEMIVMDSTGDTKTMWSTQNPDEVEIARKTFDSLKKKGYIAYRVKPDDATKGEIMTEFDPEAGKMIMSPGMRGG